MNIRQLTFALLTTLVFSSQAQVPATSTDKVEQEKFVFLNNGTTLGMIIKSVLKADTKRLKLTEPQVPKARDVIKQAVVNYNDGVKSLKKSGMNQKKLRTLAITVETDKLRSYKPILTPEQYAVLVAQHRKMYPEAKLP